MVTAIEQSRRLLRSLEGYDGPLVTVYADLSPGAGGAAPTARTVIRGALAHLSERYVPVRDTDLESLQADLDTVELAIEAAIESGARGLLYAGCAASGVRYELRTPHPFRNSARIGDHPWLFELERYHYLLGHPVTLVTCDLHTANIYRMSNGEEVAHETVDYSPHYIQKTFGRERMAQSSRANVATGGAVSGPTGGYSMYRLQNVIEEHRAMFARDAAAAVGRVATPDDILVVAGVSEARAQLLAELDDGLGDTVVQVNDLGLELETRAALQLAAGFAEQERYRRADELAREWLAGAAGDRVARGYREVREALLEGRLGRLIFHEDIVDHWGTAADARFQPSPASEDDVEVALYRALDTSAEVLFARAPDLMERSEGLIGLRRW